MEEKMDSYIVRMYRRDADNPENLVGLVETVGEEEKRPFHSVSELVAILSESHSSKLTVAKPALRLIETGMKNPR
jgi:hypothetical protein